MKPSSITRTRGSLLLAASLLLIATGAIAARQFITIGTGNVMGVPYHAGGAICALVNAGRTDHQIRCTATSSAGSIENIDALRRGERDFGFAQSDLVQHAFRGSGPFADRGGFGGLRVVAALHPETLTLVAAPGSGIADLQGLRGRRVNVGAPGSGERATLQALLDALGWTGNDFAATASLGIDARVDALCSGELDAAVFVSGHPSNAVQSMLRCGGSLVPVGGPAINRLVRDAGYYATTVIPGGVYPGVTREVPTYGVTSLLVSSTNTSRETVHEVTRALFDSVARLRDWHGAFADLQRERMARGTRVVAVPLHPGADMYFVAEGLL